MTVGGSADPHPFPGLGLERVRTGGACGVAVHVPEDCGVCTFIPAFLFSCRCRPSLSAWSPARSEGAGDAGDEPVDAVLVNRDSGAIPFEGISDVGGEPAVPK